MNKHVQIFSLFSKQNNGKLEIFNISENSKEK